MIIFFRLIYNVIGSTYCYSFFRIFRSIYFFSLRRLLNNKIKLRFCFNCLTLIDNWINIKFLFNFNWFVSRKMLKCFRTFRDNKEGLLRTVPKTKHIEMEIIFPNYCIKENLMYNIFHVRSKFTTIEFSKELS